jgi:hypothetical protein
MTVVETGSSLTAQQLGLIFQYTVEAYKTFQKLAENLPNPMSAKIFADFATEERENRDLIELKYITGGVARIRVTLGGDLLFQDIVEGELGWREGTEFMIARERTMTNKLMEFAKTASPNDRNLLIYLAAGKRAHIVLLERELELIRLYPDWYRREDAESLIVQGFGN